MLFTFNVKVNQKESITSIKQNIIETKSGVNRCFNHM